MQLGYGRWPRRSSSVLHMYSICQIDCIRQQSKQAQTYERRTMRPSMIGPAFPWKMQQRVPENASHRNRTDSLIQTAFAFAFAGDKRSNDMDIGKRRCYSHNRGNSSTASFAYYRHVFVHHLTSCYLNTPSSAYQAAGAHSRSNFAQDTVSVATNSGARCLCVASCHLYGVAS